MGLRLAENGVKFRGRSSELLFGCMIESQRLLM